MAQLFVLSGVDVGRSFDVRSGDTIGRSQDCILVFKDASISRRHAHLEEEGGVWSVHDDGSRNGIHCGGVRARRVALADGQEFQLGEVLMRFRCEAPSAAAAPAPAAPRVPELEPAAPPTRPAPPPVQRSAPAARPARPADELVLEGADEIDLAATAPRAAPAAARAGAREGLEEQRGRVLQYHRTAETGSRLSIELEQLPAWKRYGVYLLALLLLAGIAVAAFLGAAFVKDRLAAGRGASSTVETPAQGD